jgi:hypothetical protein
MAGIRGPAYGRSMLGIALLVLVALIAIVMILTLGVRRSTASARNYSAWHRL